MWTLSGFKRFTHVPEISIYQHEDVCAIVRQLEEDPDAAEYGSIPATQEVATNITFWQSLIKQENLVTVVRLDDPSYHNGIDKVWSYSGIYKELNKLDKDACD